MLNVSSVLIHCKNESVFHIFHIQELLFKAMVTWFLLSKIVELYSQLVCGVENQHWEKSYMYMNAYTLLVEESSDTQMYICAHHCTYSYGLCAGSSGNVGLIALWNIYKVRLSVIYTHKPKKIPNTHAYMQAHIHMYVHSDCSHCQVCIGHTRPTLWLYTCDSQKLHDYIYITCFLFQ